MNENGIDTSEQVLNLPRRSYVAPVEEAGQAIIAKIQKAADLSNENCDRRGCLVHRPAESRDGPGMTSAFSREEMTLAQPAQPRRFTRRAADQV
jgi:hypothetical protein